MDAELLQGFIEETASYLPDILTGITKYSEDAANIDDFKNAQKQIHTLKGAALMIGLPEIGSIFGEIDTELKQIIETSSPLTTEKSAALFEKLESLELILAQACEGLEETSTDIANFDEESFGNWETGETSENKSNTDEGFGDFEIDSEMLEIFAMEAEDHLRNLGNNLTQLEANPNNREALLEIRRSAHTLKGSAGIVGFKKLSALAHRVEDLLDYLSENEVESNSNVFELLLASTDCLEALTNGQDSPELDRKISDIYQRFDKTTALLQASKFVAVTQPKVFDPIKIEPNALETDELLSLDSPTNEFIEPVEHQTQSADIQNRSVIRVSLDRLDDLVKLVSEMVSSRSVFEQRLSEFEQQIQELQHINHRLRNSSGKLELDFGSGVTGQRAFSLPSFGFKPQNINSFFSKELDEFDSLEFDQYTDFHQTTRELVETAGDTSAVLNGVESLFSNMDALFNTQRRVIEEMQTGLLRLRMVPLSSLSNRLHRTVRVTAAEEGKSVDLEIENEAVEVDTQILDSFVEPLIHLLRNAVAHGIEPSETRILMGKPEKGKISLRAYSEGTHIVFVISDDGRGIAVPTLKEKAVEIGYLSPTEAESMTDEQAYSLIFLPSLSTATEIDEISGRGVGMNIVKSSITRRQGTISIKSEPQKGTTFTIRMPMSLAVTRAILVKSDDQTFALPLKVVKQVTEITPAELEKIIKEKVFVSNGVSYNAFHFNDLLNLTISANPITEKIPLLLLETSETPCALVVEQLIKPEEIVIKPLGNLYRNTPEIIGATILGDGSVVPVLDLVYLIKQNPKENKQKKAKSTKVKSQVNILIVDDSPSVRQINSNLIKNVGWHATAARDGLEALEILQLMRQLPDIILTDVEMPRMDGYELLASLKRQPTLQSIPVIMITSRAGDKHRRKAFDLGASEYLTKPYEEAVLIEKIKSLVTTT